MSKSTRLSFVRFYFAIRNFKRRYNSELEINSQRLIADAKAIYEEFIAVDAKQQVNIPGESIETIRKLFTDTFRFPKVRPILSQR